MAYINKEQLDAAMYHEAFEKDSDFQKWDSGCWIRYKLYENVLKSIPTADVVEVVRCKDCKHRPTGSGANHDFEFPDDECPCQCEDYWYSWIPQDNWFCPIGERKETEDAKIH